MAHTMDAGAGGYDRQVGMGEAVKLFFSNYIKFEGRSNRGEYWWAYLGILLILVVAVALDALIGIMLFTAICYLAIIVPGIAISIRRLHDIDKSGWWLLIALTGIGSLVLLYFYVQPPTPGPNRFG